MRRNIHHISQKFALGSIGLLLGSAAPVIADSLHSNPQSLSPLQLAQTPTPGTRLPTPNPQPLQVTSRLQTEWHTGFCMAFTITNTGTTPIPQWRLQFTLNQAEIYNRWNGTFNRQENQYSVIPADWGRNLPAGQRVDLGFCATKGGADYLPTEIAVEAF